MGVVAMVVWRGRRVVQHIQAAREKMLASGYQELVFEDAQDFLVGQLNSINGDLPHPPPPFWHPRGWRVPVSVQWASKPQPYASTY